MTVQFLWGAVSMACFVAGLFFFKFWKQSRERLFLAFGAAFWMLALNWVLLAMLSTQDENRGYFYVLRLAAFLLLIVGIVDRNRRR